MKIVVLAGGYSHFLRKLWQQEFHMQIYVMILLITGKEFYYEYNFGKIPWTGE